jgi:hypothetical protein
LKEKNGRLELVSLGKGVGLGLVVEGEEWATGTCVVEFSLRLHIPNSTESFKLDRRETGPTVCLSLMELAVLTLF